MERRRFLQLGLGGATLAATGRLVAPPPARADPLPGPFAHGVAAGDPEADGVILWTRVTPSPAATPGSGLGPPTPVGWQVADGAGFDHVVASGQVVSSASSDHTVKVDVDGLEAGTDHWYRFTALGSTSIVGRFRTAPVPGSATPLRFGVVSCSNWEGGFFSPYRHLAARDDLDAVLHLGDYVYEYEAGGYGAGTTFGRTHDPTVEMTTLEHLRRRHAQYKTDPDLRTLHQRYAFITTIDDHEVADNSWSGGAVNHDPEQGDGDWAARQAAAMQAYFEWMPIRATGGAVEPARVWRRLGFGGLADVIVLDERTYRSQQVQGAREDLLVTSAEVHDPGRTMLGSEQLAFVEDALRGSTATWHLLVNGVMFAPLVLGDPPDSDPAAPLLDALYASLGLAPPVVFNGDQWDGYRPEQRRLGDLFGDVGGVVLLTGDIHSSWAAEVPADPATYLPAVGGPSVAVEFVTPAVSSDSFSAALASLGVPGGEQAATFAPTVVTSAGPWFKYLDADRHGFGVLEVTADDVRYDWWYVSDRTDPQATAEPAAAWRSPAGSNRLERVSGPALQPSGPSQPPGSTTTTTTILDGARPAGGSDRIAATGVDTAALAGGAAALAAAAVASRTLVRRAAVVDE